MRRLIGGIAVSASVLMASGALAKGPYGGLKESGCAAANFNGFYVGAHGGYASLTSHQNDLDGLLSPTAGFTASDRGGVLGVQVGYNMQGCHTLAGIEADWSWGGLDAETRLNSNLPDIDRRITTGIDGFGTLRARAGLVFDGLLFYATAGLAVADAETRIKQSFPIFEGDIRRTFDEQFSFSERRLGWTAGVGAEWALWNNVSLKSEVLYANFGDRKHPVNSALFEEHHTFKTDDTVWVSRVGLNVKFGK